MHNLYARYCADEIYTAVGGIVVSLNPYKPLPLYGEAQMAGYRRAAGAGTLPEQPPHVYGTAQCAYSDLLDQGVGYHYHTNPEHQLPRCFHGHVLCSLSDSC